MNSIDEDDGFLLVYGYSVSQNQSHAYILDAKDLSKGVLCKIIMSSRVPFGLHGSWVPEHFFSH
jgi:carotenoid cleavage dioxygenase-like enzyme